MTQRPHPRTSNAHVALPLAWVTCALTWFSTSCSDSGTGSSANTAPVTTGGTSTGGTTSAGTSAGGASTTAATGGTTTGGVNSGQGGATGGNGTGGTAPAGGTAPVTPGLAGAGGVGGTTGGAGGSTATNDSACKSGPPTPASGGVNFPFPQRRFSSVCAYPATCNDADISTGWQNYKTLLIVDGGDGTLRVRRPENSDDTVSEGISYGMLFAAYMGDKDTFDRLWAYAQAHMDDKGLMHWQIRADGTVQGRNSATDSDEDIGFALVMADEQWGGYTDVTKAYLGKVLASDFHADGTIKGGDSYDDVNPSYLAPAFYRAFAKYTGEMRWLTVLDKAYETLNGAAHATTGLVPDWSTGPRGPNYLYDAARTPYRIALDACWNDEPRAKAYAEKIGKFFAGVGVANIKDGFNLDGTVIGMYTNSTFIGPAGVAGMVAKETLLITEAYAKVATDLQAGTESYYNLSWALFSGLMMTGNFVDLSAL